MKKRNILLVGIIILECIIYLYFGYKKTYIHMDEAYSLGLSTYNKINIQDNEDFYNKWHNNTYYEDYITLNTNETSTFKPVYINQVNDVHPPLYYLFLRIFMLLSIDKFSKWPGIILNIIIFIFINIFSYLILYFITKDNKKSLLITLLSNTSLASISSVIYIRMYAMCTLNILITTYIHLLLYNSKKINYKLLFLVSLTSLIGSLTHYYFLFYLFGLFIFMCVKYYKEKRYKELLCYFLSLFIAGSLSLLIFPYSIKHLFFGYRGAGSLEKFKYIDKFSTNINGYLYKINDYGFNGLLIIVSVILVFMILKKKKVIKYSNEYMKVLIIPSVIYFLFVSLTAPYIELRYVLPIIPVIFYIVSIYWLEMIHTLDKKHYKLITIIIITIFLINPFLLKRKPEVLYLERKEVVDNIKLNKEKQAIYLYDTSNNRFLDDIYLFSIISKSYIAKDIEINDVNKIIKNNDISKEIVIFANGKYDNKNTLDKVKRNLAKDNITFLGHLNVGDVYLVY